MDVTLVLTHRCNLACDYCYAGEHHRADMDEATLERGLDLLFSDGARDARLGFFGGEPLLRYDAMRRAVVGARARAVRTGGRLLVQLTTNGTLIDAERARWLADNQVVVTVSLDGVAEAHDAGRRKAGGASSFADVVAGLRALLAEGVRPQVLMVITPENAGWLAWSVAWLWDLGVTDVRANLHVAGRWTLAERDQLREQLLVVGEALITRRQQGLKTSFDPFVPRSSAGGGACGADSRSKVTVATGGALYPCAPMVGEDRGDSTRLRIGQLGAGAVRGVAADGCGAGACACAAFLETGDPAVPGPNYLWFGEVCREIGGAVTARLAAPPAQGPPRLVREVVIRRRSRRRGVVAAIVLGTGGLSFVGVSAYERLAAPKPCEARPPAPGNMLAMPSPPPVPPPQPVVTVVLPRLPPPPGGMAPAPPPPPPPPPRKLSEPDGKFSY